MSDPRKALLERAIFSARKRHLRYRESVMREFVCVPRTRWAQVVDEFCERMTEWMMRRGRAGWR